MNNRIQELESRYNHIGTQKRFLSNASVYNPQASGLISKMYKVLDELQAQVFQEIQDLKRAEQTLQGLFGGIPNIDTEKAMEEEISTESYDSVEDMFSQILNAKKENHKRNLSLQEEEKKDRETVDKIAVILQERANATEKPMRFRVQLSQLGFVGVFEPKK